MAIPMTPSSLIASHLILVGVFAGGGCSRDSNQSPRPPVTRISLEVGADPVGTSPSYSVTVHRDGRVEYVGLHFTTVSGRREYRIAQSEALDLMAQFEQVDISALVLELERGNCESGSLDVMLHRLVVATTEGEVTVDDMFNLNMCPSARRLRDLEAAVVEAAGARDLIRAS